MRPTLWPRRETLPDVIGEKAFAVEYSFRFSFETAATPDQVVAAFTDFTPARTDIWRGTLDPRLYEVFEVGTTRAVAREGSSRPRVWSVEAYEWSPEGVVPRRVRWSALSSNFCAPGSGVELAVSARPGGSRVEGRWHRSPTGLAGHLMLPLARLALPLALPKAWARTLDRYHEAR